jgi:hypothetical protein
LEWAAVFIEILTASSKLKNTFTISKSNWQNIIYANKQKKIVLWADNVKEEQDWVQIIYDS